MSRYVTSATEGGLQGGLYLRDDTVRIQCCKRLQLLEHAS